MLSPALRAWVQARISERVAVAAAGDWAREVEREHELLLIDGNETELWFLGLDGTLYSVDRDSVAHRPEAVRDPETVRAVLRRAASHQPELALFSDAASTEPSLLSPDGKLLVQTFPDSRLSGYSYEEVTRLVVTDTATRATLVDMHLRAPGLRPLRFVSPLRVLLTDDEGTEVERELPAPAVQREATLEATRALSAPAVQRELPAPEEAKVAPRVERLDYVTGRAGVVGMVSFGFASALAAMGTVGAFISGDSFGFVGTLFTLGFAALAVTARTYEAHQEFDTSAGEVREVRRSALHYRQRRWPLTSFDRVQHWRGTNRGAPVYYLTLEGRERCLLLPVDRDLRVLLPIGERLALALGLKWLPEPIPDLKKGPPR
ncbi:MAG: hypothetical protein RJA70_3003 [Pseudomonadota bacterium]|jgi:hypothetical protein